MAATPKSTAWIESFMTTVPHTIGEDIPLKTALSLMREQQIRHLPVQKSGKLVGIVTDRDIKLASGFQGSSEMLVSDVMTPDPYTVQPQTPLQDVCYEMAEKRYGCAIVVNSQNKIVGILTTTDAMRILGDLLKERAEGQKAA